MEQKTKLEVLVGGLLVLGAVLVLLAGYSWISGLGESDRRGTEAGAAAEPLTKVWTAARSMPRGTVLTTNDAVAISISGDVPAGTISASEKINDMIAVKDIDVGQLLMRPMVTDRPEEAGLAAVVPKGYRAVALRVSDDIAVSNLIRPGDRVDILLVLKDSNLPENDNLDGDSGGGRRGGGGGDLTGDDSEAHTLLQNIEVLTVGDLIKGSEAEDGENYRTLTIAVRPEQANRIALARAVGQYAFAMRAVGETEQGPGTTVTLSDIRGADAAQKKKRERTRALQESEQPVGRKRKIEVINGTARSQTEAAEGGGAR